MTKPHSSVISKLFSENLSNPTNFFLKNMHRIISRFTISTPTLNHLVSRTSYFSTKSGSGGGGESKDDPWSNPTPPHPSEGSGFSWDSVSSWDTGLTRGHFDGQAIGRQVDNTTPTTTTATTSTKNNNNYNKSLVSNVDVEFERESRKSRMFVDTWDERMNEVDYLLKQVHEPGARGSYLKDSEKVEMYKLFKENPDVYTVEKLAKDYRIMRQRVHAILWLKEDEEEMEKRLGPLDDSVELLLDTCPEFFNSHDREFHVASLPYKPEFKVMPEGWDGTMRDPDEVHYEISMREDEILYQEFVRRMNFNKMKIAGEVKCHKYSRRRSDKGWNFTVEKLGRRGKRGGGGGWKFVSLPDGSSRPLNEMEKMYVRRETVRRRRKIQP
ncbi:hypothetical protein IFM89_039468 [Coptis chinensis]|uniref:Uncharacterized protein n=1 Tax=Coptis chinensis TaxID=261450 RepID=A0A835LYD7_9MAGN|nr:hypothetical protein IFM89_039468 [Coptis chinensis]